MKRIAAFYSHTLDYEGSVNAFLAQDTDACDVIAMRVPNATKKPYSFSGVHMSPALAKRFWSGEICLRTAMQERQNGATWLTGDQWPNVASQEEPLCFKETPLLAEEDLPAYGLFASGMMNETQSKELMQKLGYAPKSLQET